MWQKIFRGLMKFFGVHSLYVLYRGGYLRDVGWFRSFKEQQAVDANGLPIPWLPYPAIAFLSDRLRSEMTVFEYGCGNSTLWLAARVRSVDSFEHNPDWHRRMMMNKPDKVNIFLREDDTYFDAASEMKRTYDVVLVDGKEREKCLDSILALTGSRGVIIWDDSERKEEYRGSFDRLYACGYRRIFFAGLGPALNNFKETSIFYRDSNCFGI